MILLHYFRGSFFNALKPLGINPFLASYNRNSNLSVALFSFNTNTKGNHQMQLCLRN